jgi:hypothetical protein
VTVLSIPSHCIHKPQSLDGDLFRPLKTFVSADRVPFT